MEGFIIEGGTWIDIDNHAGLPMPRKETLKHPSQLAVTERHNILFGPEKEGKPSHEAQTESTNPAPTTSLAQVLQGQVHWNWIHTFCIFSSKQG